MSESALTALSNGAAMASDGLAILQDAVADFDQLWQLTQEFSDPGSGVAASISCGAADTLENLLSALGLDVLARDLRVAHIRADAGQFGEWHEDWPERDDDDDEGELTAETLYDDTDDDPTPDGEEPGGALPH